MKIVCYAKSENQIAGRLEQIINAQARLKKMINNLTRPTG